MISLSVYQIIIPYMMRGKLSGKKRRILLAVVAATAFLFGLYGYGQMRTFWAEAEYRQFLKAYEARAVPLKKEATSAYYQAITSGRDEDYAQSTRLNLQLNDIYLDRTSFEKLKAFKESGFCSYVPLVPYVPFLCLISGKPPPPSGILP
jgi:hypothetical protein